MDFSGRQSGRLEYPPKRMPNGPSRLRFVRQQNSLQDQRVVYKILKPSWNRVCIRRGTVSTGWYPHCPLWSTLTILSAPSMSSPLMPSLLLFFFILIVALTSSLTILVMNIKLRIRFGNWGGLVGSVRPISFYVSFIICSPELRSQPISMLVMIVVHIVGIKSSSWYLLLFDKNMAMQWEKSSIVTFFQTLLPGA